MPRTGFYAGIDCVIAIWLRTPGDIWLGRLVGLPVIRPIAGVVYDRVCRSVVRVESLEGPLVGTGKPDCWAKRSI